MPKLIDEKGRLFGIINIIDFSILACVFVFLPVFYFGYKIYKKTSIKTVKIATPPPKSYFQTEINCIFSGIDVHVAEGISVGDTERDKNGDILSEIIKLGQISDFSEKMVIGGGEEITISNSKLRQILVTMRMKVFLQDGEVCYKDKNNIIRLNSSIEFISEKYKLKCKIDKPDKPDKAEQPQNQEKVFNKKWITLKAKFLIDSQIASVIKVGDREEDNLGNRVARLRSVRKRPAQIVTIYERQLLSLNDPRYMEVTASLAVQCLEKGKDCYYKESSLKMGNSIHFISDKYSISGTIIDMRP